VEGAGPCGQELYTIELTVGTMTSASPLAIGTGCRTCFSASIELGAWPHLTIAVSWAWTV
jgi:hypothetical protein